MWASAPTGGTSSAPSGHLPQRGRHCVGAGRSLPPSDEGGARRAEGEKTPGFSFCSNRGRNLSVFSPCDSPRAAFGGCSLAHRLRAASVAARQLPHQREPRFVQPSKDLKPTTLPYRGERIRPLHSAGDDSIKVRRFSLKPPDFARPTVWVFANCK